MRYIRFAFLALLALVLITVAVANRQMVELKAMPEFLSALLGLSPTITLPLFIVIFLGMVVGLLIGFVWEWLREHKHRAEARYRKREVDQLQRENNRLKADKHEGEDEVLALLEQTR